MMTKKIFSKTTKTIKSKIFRIKSWKWAFRPTFGAPYKDLENGTIGMFLSEIDEDLSFYAFIDGKRLWTMMRQREYENFQDCFEILF